MRPLVIIIFLFLFNHASYGQTFLEAYKKYKLDRLDAISTPKTRKKMKNFEISQIVELGTIFQAYKTKTTFDFNAADTLFIIYDSPAESPCTSDVIIWSGKDTISYKQSFETFKPFKYKRKITYESFIPKVEKPNGFKVATERYSLVKLV